MSKIANIWSDLLDLDSLVEVFEECIDFGLSLTDTKKIAWQWQLKRNGGISGAGF